jgi:hypothetical protein
VHWVEPKIVAEITYLTWTADGLLRHTVYVALREDKPAERCGEKPHEVNSRKQTRLVQQRQSGVDVKRTSRPRPWMPQLGGGRVYRGRAGKDRSPRQSREREICFTPVRQALRVLRLFKIAEPNPPASRGRGPFTGEDF